MSSRGERLRVPAEAMIAVADAGYRLALDDETWLTGVLDAACPLLDHGSFVHGWIIELATGTFRSGAAVRMPPGADFERHVRHQHPPPGDPDIDQGRRASALDTATRMWAMAGPPLAERARFPPGFGIEDCVMLGAADPSGIACALMGALPSVSRVSPRDQARWGRVASHLAAALRLRERLRENPEGASIDSADAIVEPRTRSVSHVRGDARDHLDAIRDASELLAARHGTHDADKLVAAWRALVQGRWSLIDTFDTDGKRFFVLRKNPPSAPGPDALNSVQRAIAGYVAMGHSNKAIAYHLGLSESATTRAVAEICRRLGVPDRERLAQLAGALGAHPEGGRA
ncbi:MAG: LuxR C-terminal-related transcriptional regulator [Sandaracinaceae bacterium]